MGFFNHRIKQLTDDELRETLFNAAAGSNPEALKNLLARNWDRAIALFPTWTTLPPSLRSDPSRTKRWAEGLIGVASAAAAMGDGSLMARLQGPPETNFLMLWQDALLAAQADAAGGEYDSAIRRLEQTLEKVEGLTGPGVDHLLPKTLGLLGTLHYRAGHREQAHEFTLKAKACCERIGDREGAEIYARNLSTIDAV